MTCLLGKRFSKCSESYSCNVSSKLSDLCHVSDWNRYTYEIEIKMKNDGVWGSNGDITTLLTNSQDIIMDNATKSLRENDHIWFSGQLSGNKFGVLTAKNPFVKASTIGCLACSNLRILNNVRQKSFDDEFFKCAKRLFQFILYPIVLFK